MIDKGRFSFRLQLTQNCILKRKVREWKTERIAGNIWAAGVSLVVKANKWVVRIWRNRMYYHGGYFEDLIEAVKVLKIMRQMTDQQLTRFYMRRKKLNKQRFFISRPFGVKGHALPTIAEAERSYQCAG